MLVKTGKIRTSIIRTPIRMRYIKANGEFKNLFFTSDQPKSDDNDIQTSFERSKLTLGSYVTLDWEHRQDIIKIKSKIKEYSLDYSRRRPLNIIMLAEPGSGKSHFVKCLAEKLKDDNISPVAYNMAIFEGAEDLVQPIERIRNLKVQDKLPIFFIDEFDSNKNNYPLLLPLLWDGEVQLGNRELKLGKLVIILAGSNDSISSTIKKVQKMEKRTKAKENDTKKDDESKLVDLLSRINGGIIDIPSLDLFDSGRDRRVDKICIALSLLQNRFGDSLQLVPWSLLKFIGETKFSYGIRSIALLVDLIPYPKELIGRISMDELKLPLNSTNELKCSALAYHIEPSEEDKDVDGIINRWKRISNTNAFVRFTEAQEDEDM